MTRLTKTQIKALRWLIANEAIARVDRFGRISNIRGELSPHSSATFLRLMLSGHCIRHAGPDHITITDLALEAIR